MFYLKTQGSISADAIAQHFDITIVGARQHLLKLQKSNPVNFRSQGKSVGRPNRFWEPVPEAQARLPDTHPQLSPDMIASVRELYGENGYLLVGNHYPICAAASKCQGFCRSEPAIFRKALSKDCLVERLDYLPDSTRRYNYRIAGET